MEAGLDVYSGSSEDDESSTAEESSDDSDTARNGQELQKAQLRRRAGPINLFQKLINREKFGNFAGRNSYNQYAPQQAFEKVPNRLKFCLKDVVPHCFLQGHIFMGLSTCGQFLLSYRVCCIDNLTASHFSFHYGYKYDLYFWIYQPHKPLSRFFKCPLFDDHGVDNLKKVTITQWRCSDPRVLIVHGAGRNELEESYITYVKVPKLGCLDCKKLRDADEFGFFRLNALCLRCNLTIHTKYTATESDSKFNPYNNLICPERILIVSNGFIHMLHIEIMSGSGAGSFPSQPQLFAANRSTPSHEMVSSTLGVERRTVPATTEEHLNFDNHNIIARIIADFSDIETDSTHSSTSGRNLDISPRPAQSDSSITSPNSALTHIPRKTYDDIKFSCSGNASPKVASGSSVSGSSVIKPNETNAVPCSSSSGTTARFRIINNRGKRHQRIVTKSFRNGVTTVDLHPTSSVSTASTSSTAVAADKLNAYEFSEDNEKCEKIATLRKRRLADKKYEFSEDNSENIIPFTKIRSASKSLSLPHYTSSYGSAVGTNSVVSNHTTRSLHRSSGPVSHPFHNSPCASPSSSPRPSHASPSRCDSRHCTPPPIHRASPIGALQQGFRSPPCSSPIAGGLIRSPNRHVTPTQIYGHKSPPHTISTATQQMLNFKPLGTLSPLQVSMTKRYLDLGSAISPNTNVPFLSPRREEFRVVEVPLQGEGTLEKPVCTKKFKRRYVEEDDAASVITSEEDDCISPGYHTSLPMEVHGSCYSEMQMISQASYQQLNCTSVVVTQHSFDLETFTYYTISALCQKNDKTYDVFYDWACELIKVCPHSQTIMCLLMAQFSARDQLPISPANCQNCSKKLDCIFHRRQFECRILFTWNMETGEWVVLDYGEMNECKLSDLVSPLKGYGPFPVNLTQTAKKLAQEMSINLSKVEQDYASNLRVLDSNIRKSKLNVVDHDNLIELCLKRPRNEI